MKFLKTKEEGSPSILRTCKLCPLERNLQVNSRNAPFRIGIPNRLSSPNKESGLSSGQDQVVARLLGFDSKRRKMAHKNGADGVPDKPLDLSDRPSSSCQLEKESEAKDVLMAGQEKPSVTQPKGLNATRGPEHPEDQEDTINRFPDQNLHPGPFKVPSAPPFIRTIIQHLLDVKVGFVGRFRFGCDGDKILNFGSGAEVISCSIWLSCSMQHGNNLGTFLLFLLECRLLVFGNKSSISQSNFVISSLCNWVIS